MRQGSTYNSADCQPSTSSSTTLTPGASSGSRSPGHIPSEHLDGVHRTPVRSYVLPREDSCFQAAPDPRVSSQSSGSQLRRRSRSSLKKCLKPSRSSQDAGVAPGRPDTAAADARTAQARPPSQAWQSTRATSRSSSDLDVLVPDSAADLAASSPVQRTAARPAALQTAPSELAQRRKSADLAAAQLSRQQRLGSPVAGRHAKSPLPRPAHPEQLHSARSALKAAQAHAIRSRDTLKFGLAPSSSRGFRTDDSAREQDTVRFVTAKLQQNASAAANQISSQSKHTLLSNQSTVASLAGSHFQKHNSGALLSQHSDNDLNDPSRLKSLRVNITSPAIQSAPAPGIVPASYRAAAHMKGGASTLSRRKAAPFIKGNAGRGMPDATYFGLDCLDLGPQIAMDARERTRQWVHALELPGPTKKLVVGPDNPPHSSSFPPVSSPPRERPGSFRRLFGCLAF